MDEPTLDEALDAFREEIEGAVATVRGKMKVSCPVSGRGCWGCCRGEVAVSRMEVDRLLPLVSPEALERASALRERLEIGDQTYICPLLDPTTKACTVYVERPMVCRGYLAVTPLEHCYPERSGVRQVASPSLPISIMAVAVEYLAQRGSPEEKLANVLVEIYDNQKA